MSDFQDEHRAMMAARSFLQLVHDGEARPYLDGEVVTVRLDDLLALRGVLKPVAGDWKPYTPGPAREAAPGTPRLVIPERRPELHGPDAAARDEVGMRSERRDIDEATRATSG